MEPGIVLASHPQALEKLEQEINALELGDSHAEALPLRVWYYSLLAIKVPTLRQYGRDLWRQLERGFKYVDKEQLNNLSDSRNEASTTNIPGFPKGLTPDPLD